MKRENFQKTSKNQNLKVKKKSLFSLLYFLYISLVPSLSSFYLLEKMTTNFSSAIYIWLGLFISILYIAVRIETTKEPQNLSDKILVILPIITPLYLFFKNQIELNEYFGMLALIEFFSIILSLIIIGLISGGIRPGAKFSSDLELLKNSPLIIFKNLKRFYILFIFLGLMLAGLVYLFIDLIISLEVYNLFIFFVFPIAIGITENIKALYKKYRNDFDYGVFAILSCFAWFGSYVLNSLLNF